MSDFQNPNMNDAFKSKGPELLVDLAEQCAFALKEIAGMDDEKSHQIAREVAEKMAAHWGGQNIYFPMGLSYKLSKRDHQIFADFNGTNHSELARKYGVSLQWIYKIVKMIRKEELGRRQGNLFGSSSDTDDK